MQNSGFNVFKQFFPLHFFKYRIDWAAVNTIFEKVQREKLLENIEATVLQTKNKVSNGVMDKYVNAASRENFTKSAVVNLMATPEYQLC